MQRFVSRCIPLVLILECVCAYTSLNLSNSTVLEHLAGVESLVPAGGPFGCSGVCNEFAIELRVSSVLGKLMLAFSNCITVLSGSSIYLYTPGRVQTVRLVTCSSGVESYA